MGKTIRNSRTRTVNFITYALVIIAYIILQSMVSSGNIKSVLKGMLVGNALAFLFCLIQGTTHLIKLDPANYFVSFVPVHLPFWGILGADIAAFLGIVLLMWLPALSISKIDPAETVKTD